MLPLFKDMTQRSPINDAHVCMGVGHLLECGQPIIGHSPKEERFSLSQKLSNANSS